MDNTEKGISAAEPKIQKRICLQSTLLVGTFVISLTALALAAAVYIQVRPKEGLRNGKNAGGVIVRALNNPFLEKRALEKIESSLKRERGQRSTHGYGCSSTGRAQNDNCCSSINASTVPTAHISAFKKGLPGDRNIELHHQHTNSNEQSDIITKGWRCNPSRRMNTAHVQGGMKFDGRSGFLILPVSGVYFIYSQVLFTITQEDASNTVPIKMGHKTVVCRPEHTCEMAYPGTVHMESYASPYDDALNRDVHYHGGLFFFHAGTKIAIVALYDDRVSLGYRATWEGSFMGAFLVSHDDNDVHSDEGDMDIDEDERERS